jgi:hypothetical protein
VAGLETPAWKWRAILGAASAIALVILPGCGDDGPSTATGPSGQSTSTRSHPSETSGAGSSDERRSGRSGGQTRTGRRARRQEQGRLGAQTGGSPVQGERFGATRGEARVATIILSGGGPVGGVQRVRFREGKRVRLIVRSNTDEVIRIPGYSLRKRVRAGGSARFQFKTTKVGLFPIELVRGQTRIGVLQIG